MRRRVRSWALAIYCAAFVLDADAALAEQFTASGTWAAGTRSGTWQGNVTRTGDILDGQVALVGAATSETDLAGSVVGDRIQFAVLSAQHEIATFTGSISLNTLAGSVTMDGATGTWEGEWQPVHQPDGPILHSRSGAVDP